ncbi:hypothetical protein [Jeotgalicoccus marinus]|uniref:hypothetical protein n=1 Tax=Jeotgalicoccus marinus TaxID=516700 RepID=UPI000416D278|nr:hypothetical protein [Jeotgalicoccus marinus]
MKTIEVIFPANIGDMSGTKANTIRSVIDNVLEPLQRDVTHTSKKLDFNIDVNPQTFRIGTSTGIEESFLDTPASEIIAKVTSEIFKALLHDYTGNVEVVYTVTNELNYNWIENRTQFSNVDGIKYSGYKLSYQKDGFLGDVLVQPDYNQGLEKDIKETFFQAIMRNSNLANTNIKDSQGIEDNISEIIRRIEGVYKDASKFLSDDVL